MEVLDFKIWERYKAVEDSLGTMSSREREMIQLYSSIVILLQAEF